MCPPAHFSPLVDHRASLLRFCRFVAPQSIDVSPSDGEQEGTAGDDLPPQAHAMLKAITNSKPGTAGIESAFKGECVGQWMCEMRCLCVPNRVTIWQQQKHHPQVSSVLAICLHD